jgi:hypothetical protein
MSIGHRSSVKLVVGRGLLSSITTSTESKSKQQSQHQPKQTSMAGKVTAFFKAKPKAPEPEMIHWKTMKAVQGTTAQTEVPVKARVGSHVMHTEHGKVTLVSQPAPDKLEIEYITDTSHWPGGAPGAMLKTRLIVDAVECSDPTALARARDPVVYMDNSDETIAAELARRAMSTAIQVDNDARGIQPVASKGKGKAKATTSMEPTATPTEPKKRGRPKGAKDKKPRAPRSATKVAWIYEGSKAAKGRQVAAIGAAVEHDGLGRAILLEQVDLDHLQLQAGTEGNEYAVSVESIKCFAVENLASVEAAGAGAGDAGVGGSGEVGSGAGGSGAGGSGAASSGVVAPKRRKTGGRKRKELTPVDKSHGLNPLSTKADVQRVQKRQKREEAAAKRGKPLKPLRVQMNRKWDPAIKEQAVALYHSKFATADGKGWEPCTKELLKFPGYEGLTSANLRSWVVLAAERVQQEPNEYGLMVTRAGRTPTLPAELYEEIKTLVKGLAAARAIRVCSSSMLPVVRPLIVHRLGADVIRPGRGGFIVGPKFLKQLAKDAGLRWRKPYGDARKPPADADAQIGDMIMRLAYLMKEHSIPRALVLNFDHTGLHFMQQRGNTFTAVEEDTSATHQSRPSKQKETKLKGLNDKRQATGTVGTSFAGDVLPAQLIVEGTPANHGALPDLDGCTYAKGRGNNPGHAIGWRLAQYGLDASRGRREREWLGHLVQTTNHWANIRTSYAILEFIIIPWLLAKKASMDLAEDHSAILIVDCWYGWKDQDKQKTLQNFRDCMCHGSERSRPFLSSRAHDDLLESRTCRRA